MSDPELYQAKEAFIDFPTPAEPVPVHAGTLARAGHPIVKRNPTMWVPAVIAYDVEQPKAAARKTSGG